MINICGSGWKVVNPQTIMNIDKIICMTNNGIKKYKRKAHGFGLFVCIYVGKWEPVIVQKNPNQIELCPLFNQPDRIFNPYSRLFKHGDYRIDRGSRTRIL